MRLQSPSPVIAVALATMLWASAAAAEEAADEAALEYDHIADRGWRFIVGTPAVRLDAYPLGWQINGEMGVEFARFNIIAATMSISDRFGGGGGLGYLYQHTFIRNYVYLQAGAFLGYWYVEGEGFDDDAMAFFAPTVRVIAGYRYAFLQVGFRAQIGNTVVPSFDLGLHFKI